MMKGARRFELIIVFIIVPESLARTKMKQVQYHRDAR